MNETAVDSKALTSARYVELVVLALLLIGLLMAYSANAPYSVRTGDLSATWRGFYVHAVKVGVAVMCYLAARRLSLPWLKANHRLVLVAAVAMLALVLIPGVGSKINGARRWFQFGPFTFQPVEFAKLAIVVTVAANLQALGSRISDLNKCARLVIKVLLPVGVLLFMQPDLGSTCLIAGLVFLLMIFAGARPSHYLPATLVSFAGFLIFAWLFMPHFLERLSRHTNPQPGDQAYQSLVALGSGGLFGLGDGIGGGMAKLGYLPMISSDFVFAAIGEEMGFIGSSLVVLLFLLLTVLGTRIVLAQRSMFRFLLGAGIVMSIAVQVLINLVVVTALTPTKGIALPFISAGGSALAMSMFSIGILINLAHAAPEDLSEPAPYDPDPATLAQTDISHGR